MKAKVIKTGEIVNVVPTGCGWVADFGDHIRHYTDPELDFEFADWENFRREVAKNVVCALLLDNRTSYSLPYEWFCKQAVEVSDELIKQLKEK